MYSTLHSSGIFSRRVLQYAEHQRASRWSYIVSQVRLFSSQINHLVHRLKTYKFRNQKLLLPSWTRTRDREFRVRCVINFIIEQRGILTSTCCAVRSAFHSAFTSRRVSNLLLVGIGLIITLTECSFCYFVDTRTYYFISHPLSTHIRT